MVISAYREDVSESDFVNLGLDYGVVEDLWEMVDQGIIQIGSELVVGLSDLTLYDHFETNPTYPWHRAFYEPYCYFQRDRLRLFLEEQLVGVLTGNLSEPAYGDRQKIHYTGSLSQQELEEKVATSKYTNLPLEDFQENMNALEKLADYCDRHGVRMRAVWMPLNPSLEVSNPPEQSMSRPRPHVRSRAWNSWIWNLPWRRRAFTTSAISTTSMAHTGSRR